MALQNTEIENDERNHDGAPEGTGKEGNKSSHMA